MKRKRLKLTALCIALTSTFSYAETPLYSDYDGNGYVEYQPCISEFTQTTVPIKNASWSLAHSKVLKQQQAWLSKLSASRKLTPEQQLTMQLAISPNAKEVDLTRFHAVLSSGERCGNTLITGYVTPELELKRHQDNVYRYPVYKKPLSAELQHLSRTEIEKEHKLSSKNLEIGYSKSPLDVFLLQVQGSGFIHFIDTDEHLTLGYAGKNGHAYASLGKYMIAQNKVPADKMSVAAIREYYDKHPDEVEDDLLVNQSYVFFAEQHTAPKASNTTEATAGVTVAIDDKYIPHGSLLLVEFPVLDKNKQIVRRDYRLMFANDRGGNIKGAGRLDVYMGTDEHGAGLLNQYGRVWLLD